MVSKTLITREVSFHMGHRVPNHKSKCRNLHGHTYNVIIGVEGLISDVKGKSEEGMVIDFGDLKDILKREVYDKFDHAFMVYRNDPLFDIFMKESLFKDMEIVIVDFVPTAENIAKNVFDLLSKIINDENKKLKYVTVWETKLSSATYSGEQK